MLNKIAIRAFKIIKNYKLYVKAIVAFRNYKTLMNEQHPFYNFKVKIVPFQKISPFEFFDYYSVFYYWVSDFLKDKVKLNILSLGGVKLGDAILSIKHNIYSIVLEDPLDQISKVNYVKHDIYYPLPFPNNFFDVFISPATLHLVGLGRYGDKLSPDTLFLFLKELKRVLKKESDVFICIPLGENALIFNHHYIFDFDTILKIFNSFSFKLEEYFVDEFAGVPGFTSYTDAKALNLNINSNAKTSKNTSQFATYNRFTKDTDCSKLAIGEYKIIYLHFKLI